MFNLEQKAVIWLSLIEKLSIHAKCNIFNSFENIADIWRNQNSITTLLKRHLHDEEIPAALRLLDSDYIDNYINDITQQGINIITVIDENYSYLLKNTDAFPLVLYYKGNISLLNTPCLAVVGTRRATRYGKDITKKLVNEIAYSGITIVSGLADGIDQVAHESALEVGGKTIVVLPSGLNNIYPSTNVQLAEEIFKKGLVVSEFAPNQKIKSYHFVIRNRIIAGLSQATLVTEAPKKSGAMITKNYALSYNRDIFAVPSRLNDTYGEGCNYIIKECQSAIVLNSNDILQSFGEKNKYSEKKTAIMLSENEKSIYNLLKTEKNYNQLINETGFDTKSLNTLLTTMELKGIIKKSAGNYYKV